MMETNLRPMWTVENIAIPNNCLNIHSISFIVVFIQLFIGSDNKGSIGCKTHYRISRSYYTSTCDFRWNNKSNRWFCIVQGKNGLDYNMDSWCFSSINHIQRSSNLFVDDGFFRQLDVGDCNPRSLIQSRIIYSSINRFLAFSKSFLKSFLILPIGINQSIFDLIGGSLHLITSNPHFTKLQCEDNKSYESYDYSCPGKSNHRPFKGRHTFFYFFLAFFSFILGFSSGWFSIIDLGFSGWRLRRGYFLLIGCFFLALVTTWFLVLAIQGL